MKYTPPTQSDALLARCRRLLHDHRTRARLDGQRLDYGLVELRDLLSRSPMCSYCKMPLSFAVELDHRQPVSRGGHHALSNLAACCPRCNSLKGQLTEGEFRDLLAWLVQHPRAAADLERRILAGGTRYTSRRRARSKPGFGSAVPE
jgi:5-methylcytosine-specific restriction endonuclease McrA